MDHNKLRTLVFEKTGIKIDSNDPIFALVALNETVLAESVGKHVALMDEASARFEMLAKQLQAGGALPATTPQSATGGHFDWRLLAGAAAVALASALLVLGGQALFGHGSTTAAAAALTPEQSALLQTGEKFNRVLQRLDEPTRAKIQAEMHKP